MPPVLAIDPSSAFPVIVKIVVVVVVVVVVSIHESRPTRWS